MFPQYNANQMYQQMLQPLQQQILGPEKREVIKVSGGAGVDAFTMGPNESALLLDLTAPIVWLVQTDGAGYKTKTAYDISPHVEVKEEDKFKSLEERITKLEERIDAKSYNGQTNGRKPEQHNDAGNRSNAQG